MWCVHVFCSRLPSIFESETNAIDRNIASLLFKRPPSPALPSLMTPSLLLHPGMDVAMRHPGMPAGLPGMPAGMSAAMAASSMLPSLPSYQQLPPAVFPTAARSFTPPPLPQSPALQPFAGGTVLVSSGLPARWMWHPSGLPPLSCVPWSLGHTSGGLTTEPLAAPGAKANGLPGMPGVRPPGVPPGALTIGELAAAAAASHGGSVGGSASVQEELGGVPGAGPMPRPMMGQLGPGGMPGMGMGVPGDVVGMRMVPRVLSQDALRSADGAAGGGPMTAGQRRAARRAKVGAKAADEQAKADASRVLARGSSTGPAATSSVALGLSGRAATGVAPQEGVQPRAGSSAEEQRRESSGTDNRSSAQEPGTEGQGEESRPQGSSAEEASAGARDVLTVPSAVPDSGEAGVPKPHPKSFPQGRTTLSGDPARGLEARVGETAGAEEPQLGQSGALGESTGAALKGQAEGAEGEEAAEASEACTEVGSLPSGGVPGAAPAEELGGLEEGDTEGLESLGVCEQYLLDESVLDDPT